MTLSPTSRLDRKNVQGELVLAPPYASAAKDDDEATMPSPLSKNSRRPDVDDESTDPPPMNTRRSRDDSSEQATDADHLSFRQSQSDEQTRGHQLQDSLATPTITADSGSPSGTSNNEETAATLDVSFDDQVPSSLQPQPDVEGDPEEAESIALARMLMEQEAIESYGALSADYLRYNAEQFSQEDLAALQAAMADDDGSDDDGDGAGDQPFSYDVMLRLGESIGDVKKERWNLVSQSQIDKLETFTFDPKTVEGMDENDCNVKCLVCQFPYEKGESLRRLPCSHTFHSDCVAGWLKDNDVCPYCRQTIAQE